MDSPPFRGAGGLVPVSGQQLYSLQEGKGIGFCLPTPQEFFVHYVIIFRFGYIEDTLKIIAASTRR
jgi:hypothetical protein